MGFRRAFVGIVIACLTTIPVNASDNADPADPATWIAHVNDDLLPYWSDVIERSGKDGGRFPMNLNIDGSYPDNGGGSSVIPQTRQAFAYGVAFHMTGEVKYLNLARDGVDFLFDTYLDPDVQLFRQFPDSAAAEAMSQIQSYGLLGPGFLYYLTRDEELLARIRSVEAAFETRL